MVIMQKTGLDEYLRIIQPKKDENKAWFLGLLDEEGQRVYEQEHVQAVMQVLRAVRIRPHKMAIKQAEEEITLLQEDKENTAENYPKIKALRAKIEVEKQKIEEYHPFFDEPYFARMDLTDEIEGYNSYYIGKKGDIKLEIVDWRAPLARRYYQKSCSTFTINEYVYKTVLRRAIRAKEGKLLDFKNEYLSLKDYLTAEEIADRDEENVLDPFLKEIIRARKDETAVKDIIQTIQEKQYEIITCGEKTNFVLQGCAGSGKTMVMLHRLSYLMYNNEDIKPRDVLVITPSNSFNAFIDELAEILELERVKTVTVFDYFLQVLKNLKIDISDKIDITQKEDERYLEYVYSPRFTADITKRLGKVYNDLYGLFTSAECADFISAILHACKRQLSAYESVKNASMRIRRAVLGEIKERENGGLYYTKPFRELVNCLLDIQDFLGGTLKSERATVPDYFYRQMLSFYKSATFVVKYHERIIQEALSDLDELYIGFEKEIADLKRFKQRIGDVDVYMYADRIARREELLKETRNTREKVSLIGEESVAFTEFYEYLRGEKEFVALGRGNGFIDVVRYFYRETVKKYKLQYGMTSSKMYISDAYALCAVCAELTDGLSPVFNYVFVDEAQDISPCEYALLKKINKKSTFNIFGDIAQNVTPWRGVTRWEEAFDGFARYTLNQNYRNTNQIVDYVASSLQLDMQPIGFDGVPVKALSVKEIYAFFKEKKGLKAIICSKAIKAEIMKKSYNDVTEKGRLSSKKINVLTVYESKGLEFSSVAVFPEGLSSSERYIAYTRAMKELAIVHTKKMSQNI